MQFHYEPIRKFLLCAIIIIIFISSNSTSMSKSSDGVAEDVACVCGRPCGHAVRLVCG